MMIRPFLYDFKRTITSTSVLILIGIILLISLAIIPFTTPIVSSFRGSASDILYYRDPGAYHFIVFSSDQYGQPLQGTKISISLSGVKTYANATTTNSEGYELITLGPPTGTYTLALKDQMDFLGNLTDYRQVFDPAIPSGLSGTTGVWFELFAPNGTAVSGTEIPVFGLRQQQFRPEATNIASSFFSTILSFFMPLAAILGAYSSYGKDRLTGVLESILARPISRRGLAISRFLSTLTALAVAAIVSVGLVDLVLNEVVGSVLPQDYALAIISGLVVEIAAFTGLVFLLSHLFKSTGVLLGISIVLFVVLDFFWGLIIFLLTLLLGGTSGSAVAVEATLVSYYANPAQFLQLINVYVFQTSSGTALQSSNYGVTLPAIVLDGFLWAIVPFLAFMYLAVKRD